MIKKISFIFIFLLVHQLGITQIIQISPAFPTVNDVVTIHYNASQGNGGLVGVTPVYTHTGIVTQSGLPSSWSYVQGNWGQADTNVLMTDLGNNIHEIVIDIDQYYGFPNGTNVAKLAFVFRNSDGSLEGKTATMGDIFYPIYPINGGFQAAIFKPYSDLLVNLNDTISISGQSNSNATLQLFDNGVLVADTTNTTVIEKDIIINSSGDHQIILVADDGSTILRDTVNYVVIPALNLVDPPNGLVDGINYINDSTVTLKFYAPEKTTVNLIGDHNNWMVNSSSFMSLSTDSNYWWKTISGLNPGGKYTYQYLIDGVIKIADPLSPLILDPNNDANIGSFNYPNPIPYPLNYTNGFVTVMEPGKTAYNWTNSNFIPPDNKDLIIYELLVRDFVSTHSYQTLIDTLDYLAELGVNAIELMPPGEFENNESWGYNPSFHMALDKYYGTPEHFKAFIDSCHGRGIAVINDIVFNQAFGQSPMVNLYWDGLNNRPAANNPWFNEVCPHPPYCWGYDFDHSSDATKNFMDRVNHYWLDEYHIDGFRFDFTKGFSNNSNNYDNDRINLLKRMADTIWSKHPDAYVILEHWADNNEEKILANYGMMLWGNVTHGYQESAMGYPANSNLSWGVYKYRLWNEPHLISYMESHDEERIMYKNITYGNTTGQQNAKNLLNGLKRTEGLAALMLTTPGPKMIWQFGELGYDISIDYICRTCNKPILWNYFTENSRKRLYDVYKASIELRKSHPVFTGDDFTYSLNGAVKSLKLNDPSMDAVVIVNIDVNPQDKTIDFQHNGWWYEYFSGDSIQINGTSIISLDPGDYKVFTDLKLDKPEILNTLGFNEYEIANWDVNIFPNPSRDFLNITINGSNSKDIKYTILNSLGKIIYQQTGTFKRHQINIENLSIGNYFLILEQDNYLTSKEFVKF
ncbi:MAG: T9SS type A sorting domain-containing protein [Flavobacteriales bacterium]|nr:T9SS type A sorting domain-containing protein [Flavobacteriales bacterium]